MSVEDPEYVEYKRLAYWSDAFFNWSNWDHNQGVKENAKRFLDERPACPFGVNWLIRNFRSRL